MDINRLKNYDIPALRALYESVGWVNYLKDDERFARMFSKSLACYGAFEGDTLIGLVRLVGDGEHILYIQDILVNPDYQTMGTGKALMQRALEDFSHVRQKVLITDLADTHVHAFYTTLGFVRSQDKNIVCFVKFD